MRIVLMFVQYMRNDEIICIQSMLVIASGLRPMLMDFTDSAMVRYLEQSFRQLLPALFLYWLIDYIRIVESLEDVTVRV